MALARVSCGLPSGPELVWSAISMASRASGPSGFFSAIARKRGEYMTWGSACQSGTPSPPPHHASRQPARAAWASSRHFVMAAS